MARIRCSECQWRSVPLSAYRCDYAYLAGVTRAAQIKQKPGEPVKLEPPEKCRHFKRGPRLLFPVLGTEKQHIGAMRRPVDYEKVDRMWKKGKTDREIAKELRCGAATVAAWRQKNGLEANRKPDIKIDYKKMQELYAKGLNDTQIAKRLGCSNASVYIWRRGNGLKSNWGGRDQ